MSFPMPSTPAACKSINRPPAVARFRNKVGLAPNDLVALFVGHNFALKGWPRFLKALAERKRLMRRRLGRSTCSSAAAARSHASAAWPKASAWPTRCTGWGIPRHPPLLLGQRLLRPAQLLRPLLLLVVFEVLRLRRLPVITTSCNGAGEVMTDGREGYILTAPTRSAK